MLCKDGENDAENFRIDVPRYALSRYIAIWLFQKNGTKFADVKKPTTKQVKFYLRWRNISLGAQVICIA